MPYADWGGLVRLDIMEMQFNSITGEIPNTITSLPELTYVNLSNNRFKGTVPVLWAAQKLEGFDVSVNDLEQRNVWGRWNG